MTSAVNFWPHLWEVNPAILQKSAHLTVGVTLSAHTAPTRCDSVLQHNGRRRVARQGGSREESSKCEDVTTVCYVVCVGRGIINWTPVLRILRLKLGRHVDRKTVAKGCKELATVGTLGRRERSDLRHDTLNEKHDNSGTSCRVAWGNLKTMSGEMEVTLISHNSSKTAVRMYA